MKPYVRRFSTVVYLFVNIRKIFLGGGGGGGVTLWEYAPIPKGMCPIPRGVYSIPRGLHPFCCGCVPLL